MGDRKAVACPCGRRFTTAVRGRGTHCPECRKRVYVRVDGTVRPGGAAPPSGRPAKGKAAKAGPPAAVDRMAPEPYVSLQEMLDGTAPESAIEAREIWEMNQPDANGHRWSVAEIGAEYQLSESAVRKRIAAEKRRQELEARATAAG